MNYFADCFDKSTCFSSYYVNYLKKRHMCKFVLFFVKVKHETTNYYKLHSSFNFKFPVKGEMNNFPFKLKSAEYFFFGF